MPLAMVSSTHKYRTPVKSLVREAGAHVIIMHITWHQIELTKDSILIILTKFLSYYFQCLLC